jgi:hypothetical protein
MTNWTRISLVMAGLALVAPGCDKGGGGGTESKCVTSGTAAEISGNHGHAIDIPSDAVKRGLGGTYAVKGGDHEHAVALTDADMKNLQAGQPATTRTSSVNGHVHEVKISCKP